MSYPISKIEKQRQSFSYTANALKAYLDGNKKHILAITSTLDNARKRLKICRELLKALCANTEEKGLLITIDLYESVRGGQYQKEVSERTGFDEEYLREMTEKEFEHILGKKGNEYDVILVNLPPIQVFSKALELSRRCEGLIFVEKYGCTRYHELEESLFYLERYDVPVVGTIVYR